MKDVELCKVLSSESRWEMLELLFKEHLDIEDLANKVNLKKITIRHHIRELERVGLIEKSEKKTVIGRPRIYYWTTRKGVSIQYPMRNYILLADILTQNLMNTHNEEELSKLMYGIGQKWGERVSTDLSSKLGIRSWTAEDFRKYFIEGFFGELGFQPRTMKVNNDEISFRLGNCIFYDLAVKYPSLICGNLNKGVLEGFCRKTIGNYKINHQTKSIARGDPCCEYSLKISQAT